MLGSWRPAVPQNSCGFSLIDTIATLAVFAVVAAIAVPSISNSFENQRLGVETRSLERELQTARLTAVSTNRPIRVRFNCPAAGQYRRVELIGTVNTPDAKDAETYTARCAMPYPADTDRKPLTRPNNDGPTMQLYQTVSFSATQTLEFWPNGSVHVAATTNPWPLVGATGVSITLAKGSNSKTIQVNALGKIRIQ